VLDGRGGFYFTDPRYGRRDDLELDAEAVYYVNKQGKIRRVIDGLKRPNGIILSPDGRRLYVADHAGKSIWVYTVKADGDVRAGHVLAWMNRAVDGGPDGMTVDAKGNVYAAGQGHIWVWNEKGQEIAKIPVPENPANCAFGGSGSRVLYITAVKSLYRIELDAQGIR
jgi:gluconolactonase